MNEQSISILIKRLWIQLSWQRRMQIVLLLFLMIIASFAEILSIGAILPFLLVLTDPGKIFTNPSLQSIIYFMGIEKPEQLLLPITIIFCMAVLIAGNVRLMLAFASTRLSFLTGMDISGSIYRRTLYQPYCLHLARNSSEVITGIVTKSTGVIFSVIAPCLALISSSLILFAIFAVLLTIEPTISICTFGGFSFIYLIIVWLTRKKKSSNSLLIARESTKVMKSLQEGLGGIRDVLIDGNQNIYCQIYKEADRPLRLAQSSNQFISQAPRYFVEALGMVLIATLAYTLAQKSNGVANAIPMLGVLTLSAQRMLPLMQQIYSSLTSIQGGIASLKDTLELLDQALPAHAEQPPSKPIPFTQQLRLNNISFRYSPDSAWIFRNLSLDIEKGSRIGFVGATGSGKSTLLDVVMCLLETTEGALEVDGQKLEPCNHRAWQAHISHVPQAIFLADSSIEENIAFGVPKKLINHERVCQVAKQAQIASSIEAWPQQYNTLVGERGVRLSGGQLQRIGIARALYKQSDIIIFDEATSALDNETEASVMEAIEGLSKELTLLIVAHRLTSLKGCSRIVELSDCGIRRVSTYSDFLKNNQLKSFS